MDLDFFYVTPWYVSKFNNAHGDYQLEHCIGILVHHSTLLGRLKLYHNSHIWTF
jgi:hypothetical protein